MDDMQWWALAICSVLAAWGQQTPQTAALPVRAGEWKMVAVIHRADGDKMQSFFTCNQQTDLAHLVPQPANLPREFSCTQDSQQLSAAGETLAFTCKAPQATLAVSYALVRQSDTLVTGSMKIVSDAAGKQEQSNTDIVYQWQQAECAQAQPAPEANKKP